MQLSLNYHNDQHTEINLIPPTAEPQADSSERRETLERSERPSTGDMIGVGAVTLGGRILQGIARRVTGKPVDKARGKNKAQTNLNTPEQPHVDGTNSAPLAATAETTQTLDQVKERLSDIRQSYCDVTFVRKRRTFVGKLEMLNLEL